MPLADSIHLLLRLLRESGIPQMVITSGGLFQQNLPQGRTFQLLRLALADHLQLVPEISGNRLMVSIRLMKQDAGGRMQNSSMDGSFQVTLCA